MSVQGNESSQRNAILSGLSPTGLIFYEVTSVLMEETAKLNADTYQSLVPALKEFGRTGNENIEAYLNASFEKDDKKQIQIRDKQFLAETKLINALFYNGAADIVEKLQKKALTVVKGPAINLFETVLPNAIYRPLDIALLQKEGYDFNRTHKIDGKETNFTKYNLDMIEGNNLSFEQKVKALSDELRRIMPEHQLLKEEKIKLEKQKEDASEQKKQKIEAEILKIEKSHKALLKNFEKIRKTTMPDAVEYVTAYQRLMFAKSLGAISKENLKLIEDADIKSQMERMSQNLHIFKNITDAVQLEDKKESADKDRSVSETGNKTLANASEKVIAFDETNSANQSANAQATATPLILSKSASKE